MDQQSIEDAYQPFVTELHQGGFADPADGWTAEQVAAHVSLNNDLIAEAAERIAAGEQPRYTNATVVDDDQLTACADSLGGLGGLAAAIETSAHRLALAWTAVGDNHAATPLPSTIIHEGEVIVDGPIPIRSFIERNSAVHLDMHLEQLRALRP